MKNKFRPLHSTNNAALGSFVAIITSLIFAFVVEETTQYKGHAFQIAGYWFSGFMLWWMISTVLRSLTAEYRWRIGHYLAHKMLPVVERTRAEGNVMRLNINDTLISQYLIANNVLTVAFTALQVISVLKIGFPIAFVHVVSCGLFLVASQVILRYTLSRISRESYVAKATPVR